MIIEILRIFCDSVIQSLKKLDFDRKNLGIHFCFSELLILREKGSRIFFLGHLSTKKTIKNFQKILKIHHTGELHKKGTILHQAPQITLF